VATGSDLSPPWRSRARNPRSGIGGSGGTMGQAGLPVGQLLGVARPGREPDRICDAYFADFADMRYDWPHSGLVDLGVARNLGAARGPGRRAPDHRRRKVVASSCSQWISVVGKFCEYSPHEAGSIGGTEARLLASGLECVL